MTQLEDFIAQFPGSIKLLAEVPKRIKRRRPPAEFADKNTTSPEKLNMIQRQIGVMNYKFPKGTLKGYMIGLPGAGSQLIRHIEEYKAYGFPEDKQVMVDRDPTVNSSQRSALEGYNGRQKPRLVVNEISNVVHEYWKKNLKVSGVDYDDITLLNETHEHLIRACAKNDVEMFNLVITNRCSKLSQYLLDWKKRLNLRKRYVRVNRCQEPVKKIQIGAIMAIANDCGYEAVITPYKSKPPMMSCLLLKK